MSSAAVRKKQTERTEHRLTQRWRGAGQGSRLGLATPWPCLGTPPPQLELITPPRLVTNLVQPSHRDRLPAHEQHPRSGRFRVDCLTLLLLRGCTESFTQLTSFTPPSTAGLFSSMQKGQRLVGGWRVGLRQSWQEEHWQGATRRPARLGCFCPAAVFEMSRR